MDCASRAKRKQARPPEAEPVVTMASPEASSRFLSCDWGTSSFRLNLVRSAAEGGVTGVTSSDGIGAVHQAWQARGASRDERERTYLAVVAKQVARLAGLTGRSLEGVPLVISGMASATIGLRELPYKALPFALDGSDLGSAQLAPTKEFPHPVLIVSGTRVPEDVMRGEETQLVGAAALESLGGGEALFILPGTHSKHVLVKDGRATGFRTFMTGEVFDLLARRSILANSLEEGAGVPPAEAGAAFADGVKLGVSQNLLNAAFRVRVEQISGARSRGASFHFLSGLVIGSELRDLPTVAVPLVLVGSAGLMASYEAALKVAGWPGPVRSVAGERAVIAGQRRVARHAGLITAGDPFP